MAVDCVNKYKDATAEIERNPVSKYQIQPGCGLTRDGTAEPVSRDLILRRERGQGRNIFPVLQLTNHTRLIHALLKVLLYSSRAQYNSTI